MSKKNAVQYAEDDLGVHSVYQDALARYSAYEAAVDGATEARRQVRHLKAAIEEREGDIIATHGSDRQSMSATAWKEHLKELLRADEAHATLVGNLLEAEAKRDAADADARIHEHGVRVHVARMEELAGLLNFYAAAKSTHESNERN